MTGPTHRQLTFSAKARFVLSFTLRSKRSVAENSSASNTVAEGEWMSVCSQCMERWLRRALGGCVRLPAQPQGWWPISRALVMYAICR